MFLLRWAHTCLFSPLFDRLVGLVLFSGVFPFVNSQVPLDGFQALYGSDGPQKFTVDRLSDAAKLPKAHTCFNRIDIPQYPSKSVLKKKLMYALEEGGGFGLK